VILTGAAIWIIVLVVLAVVNDDIVASWNDALVQAARENEYHPPQASRAFATMHAAMYDAVNAIARRYPIYKIATSASPEASPEAAAASAAHTVFTWLFAERSRLVDGLLGRTLSEVGDCHSREQGLVLGQEVGGAFVRWRESDGSEDQVLYEEETRPGIWRPTPPDYAPALSAQWPDVTPFVIADPSQFCSPGPPALSSRKYAEALEETKLLGGKSSTERTKEQTEITVFWTGGAGTIVHWNLVAREIASALEIPLEENVRLFCLLNLAIADAVITTWYDKYRFNFWRPITAIREADSDGNPLTAGDLSWEPVMDTPPFPEHSSAHSAVSGAASEILASFFNGGDIGFGVVSPALGGVRRCFRSFSEAAKEAARSRVYCGHHFEFSSTTGAKSGRDIGNYIWDRAIAG
jgi:hypothetical protein